MRLSEAFEILGVTKEADIDEIKAAYRRRAMETHPDRGGKQQDFIRVRAAYEIICGFFNSPNTETDIPIPEDLRELIADIVKEFRWRFEHAETTCSQEFSSFDARMRAYINMASRSQLKKFSEMFRSEWNTFVFNLFWRFNQECRETIRKYEGWFDKTMEDTFTELYQRELKAYRTSPRFYCYCYGSLLLVIGVLISYNMEYPASLEGTFHHTWIALLPLGLLPAIYWIDCQIRRKSPADLQTMSVQPFTLNTDAGFQGSATLKQGSAQTKAAGVAGLAIGDLFSKGIGIPLVGAAAGLVIGGVIDRIQNPTKKIRGMILEEYDHFITMAQPEVANYVVQSHHKLRMEIQEKIIANYEQKMKQTILLLTKT